MPRANAEDTTPEPRHPKHPEWSIVCDLEDPLVEIEKFLRLLWLVDLDDDRETEAVHAAASHLMKLVGLVEEGRGKLFDMLHPRRAEFEAAGGVEKWREKMRPADAEAMGGGNG